MPPEFAFCAPNRSRNDQGGGIFRFVLVESSVCSNIEQDVSKSLHCFVVVDVAALPVVVVANMR